MLRLTALVVLLPACAETSSDPTGETGETGVDAEPVVSLTIAPPTLTEAPASSTTFTLSLDGDVPEGGVTVYVLGDVPQSLTQTDLFSLSVSPDAHPEPVGDLTFSGFTLAMAEPVVAVTLPSFDDGTEEEPVTVTYEIVPFDEVPWGDVSIDGVEGAASYVVGGSAASLELRDTP
ncbi:MAG: hypothetical protein AAGA48_33260 [Myxococcota bacterium]